MRLGLRLLFDLLLSLGLKNNAVMGNSAKPYRIKIDKEVIRGFFFHPVSEMTAIEEREFMKVFAVVMHAYFQKYLYFVDDLRQFAWAALFDRHSRFDKTSDANRAYSYVYTLFRNEIGNKCSKFLKETPGADFPERKTTDSPFDIPLDLEEVLSVLSGSTHVACYKVPPDKIYSLLTFIERGLHNYTDAEAASAALNRLVKVQFSKK